MKILTPIKTAVAAFPQKERRDALAQFLIRYINKNAQLTHYRCVGRDTDVIVKYLLDSGFTPKVDFEVIMSELDSSVRQIRWQRSSTILNEWLTTLKNLNITPNVLFNIISNKKFSDNDLPEGLANEDSQDVQSQTSGTASDSSEHFSYRVQQTTNDIINWLQATKEDLLVFLPYDYQKSMETSPEVLHILPVAILELFATETGLLKNIPAEYLPPSPIFSLHVDNMTAARYMNKTDDLDFTRSLFDAPAKAYLFPSTDKHNNVNPLKGFLLNNWSEVLINIHEKPKSSDMFVLTSGVINTIEVPARTALAISEFTSNPKNFWKYVTALYEVVYGLRCSLVPRSRIGFLNSSRLIPDSLSIIECNNSFDCPFSSLKSSNLKNNLCMIAAVVLSDKEPREASFTPFQDTIQSNQGILATEFCVGETDIEAQAPGKKDIPVTWLAAFQVDPNQVSEGFTQAFECDSSYVSQRALSLEDQRDYMNKIRKISEHANLAELSAIVHGEVCGELSGPTNRAFIMNVASVVVQQCQAVPVKKWEGNGVGHNSSLYITNVYTGVTTDRSPYLTAENLKYFPNLKEYVDFIENSYYSLGDPAENQRVKAFTSFIEGLSGDNAKLQLSMAQRSLDTQRTYNVIVETNFDFNCIKSALNYQMSSKLKKALIQTIAFRNKSYAAALSDYYDQEDYARSYAIDNEYQKFTDRKLPDVITFVRDLRNEHDIYADRIISVDIVPDKYGRAYLIYSINASLASYITTVYRFITGAPVFTRTAIALALHKSHLVSEELANVTHETVDKYTLNVIQKQVLMHTNNSWECIKEAGLSARKLLDVWTPAYTYRCLTEIIINCSSFSRRYLLNSLYGYNSNACLRETTIDWSEIPTDTIQDISGS